MTSTFSPSPLSFVLSPSPYFLTFASGGRPNHIPSLLNSLTSKPSDVSSSLLIDESTLLSLSSIKKSLLPLKSTTTVDYASTTIGRVGVGDKEPSGDILSKSTIPPESSYDGSLADKKEHTHTDSGDTATKSKALGDSPSAGMKRMRITDSAATENSSPSQKSRTMKTSPLQPSMKSVETTVSYPQYHRMESFGQDAMFVNSAPQSLIHSFGVCDGVGGWRSQGVDSGIIARTMMKKCLELTEQIKQQMTKKSEEWTRDSQRKQQYQLLSSSVTRATGSQSQSQSPTILPFSLPSLLMSSAYHAIKTEGEVAAGSTTCCVMTITSRPCMNVNVKGLIVPIHPALPSATDEEESQPLLMTSSSSDDSGISDDASEASKTLIELGSSSTLPAEATVVDDGTPLIVTNDEVMNDNVLPPSDAITESDFDTEAVVEPAVGDGDLPLSGANSEDECENELIQRNISKAEDTDKPTTTIDTDVAPPTSPSLQAFASASASALWTAAANAATMVMSTLQSPTMTPLSSSPSSGSDIPSLSPSLSESSPSPTSSVPPLYLSCSSLGDSGFFLIRHNRVIHRSQLQRTGRIVKQLAIIPPHLRGPEHCYCDDSPEDASLTSHRLQHGDIIVAGSDGLLDNLVPPSLSSSAAAFFAPMWDRLLSFHDSDIDGSSEMELSERMSQRVESLVKQVRIDCQPYDTHASSDSDSGVLASSERFVSMLCDRLVSEAAQFMSGIDGKPDDLTVMVAQVNLMQQTPLSC